MTKEIEQFKVICQEAKPAIHGEHGDNDTYHLACQGRDLGLTAECVFEIMHGHWNAKCVPPWEPSQLFYIVSLTYKYAERANKKNAGEGRSTTRTCRLD